MTLYIKNRPVPFLTDSGATRSTLSEDYYRGETKIAEPSMGINGILTKTYKTPPLPVSDVERGGATVLHHCFRIIPNCPVNLLGRDLMGKLGITLKMTTEGGVFVHSKVIPIYYTEDSDLPPPDDPVWSKSSLDVGLISCTPYKAALKSWAQPVYHKQYPISKEKEEGVAPMVERFLQLGILKETLSPYNTPINPVMKPDGSYRFVQDLRAINNLVIPIAPIVPDVPSLLTSIPCDAEYFSVIDLCNAFFSVSVDEETQPIFAFNFRNRQMTWCRLPQGYVDSPVVYTVALQATLRSWTPRHGSVLLQYVDDLLLCSPSQKACKNDGLDLLHWLADNGHKVSKKKLQWCQETVEYLGFVLSKGERKISHKRAAALVGLPRPLTKKDMLSFLGMIGYCRQWIPDCSFNDNILRQAMFLKQCL